MSHAASQWAWSIKCVSASARHVLLALANRVNHERGDNVVWPSCDHLCDDTGLNRKTVYKALAELCAAGFLVATGVKHGRTASTTEYDVQVGMANALSTPKNGRASPDKLTRFRTEADPKPDQLSTPKTGSQNLEDITRKNQEGAYPGASEPDDRPTAETWPTDTDPTDPPQEAVVVTLPVNHNPDPREQPQPLDQPSKPKARQVSPMITLRRYLADCMAAGRDVIPGDDPVYDYAESASLPDEFVHLAWVEFRERHQDTDKKYRSWPQAFRNCVRGNWYRLWWVTADDSYELTTTGHMLRKRLMAQRQAAAKEMR